MAQDDNGEYFCSLLLLFPMVLSAEANEPGKEVRGKE